MRVVVIDTSALVRLYVPDGPIPPGAEEAVDSAWRGDCLLLAPDLLAAELGSVLLKKERAGLLTQVEVDDVLTAALGLPLRLIPHRPLLAPAIRLARETGLTVYDALFVAAAVERGAALITADADLERVTLGILTGA